MNLLKKLFSFSIGSLAALLIGIISTPIITRIIEPSEYAIATIFLTLGSLVSIISLAGLDQAFVRFFYETNRVNLLRKTVTLSIGVTAILVLMLFVLNDFFSPFISSDASYAFLMVLYVITFLIFRFSSLILRMLQFGYRYSLIQLLQKILDLFFILSIAFVFLPNRYALIMGTILTLLVLSVITLFLSASFWKTSGGSTNEVNYKMLITYSWPLLLSSFMTILFQTLDKFFLNIWVSGNELGIYAAGFKLVAILNIIQSSFTLFWAPVSLERYKNNPEDREYYGRISKMITILMMSVCIVVVLFKDVLVLFLGPDYREASSVIAILVLMPVMYTMSETTIIGVNFKLKSYYHIIISGISLIMNILLCITLIPLFGLKGASIAVSLSYVTFYFARTYYGLKNYYFDIKFKQTLIMIFAITIWMISVVITDDKSIMFLGALGLLSLLLILFRTELLESRTFIITSIKRRKE